MEQKYREERDGNKVTIYNAEGIGLQFTLGETLQAYTHALVLPQGYDLSTESAVRHLSKVSNELNEYAALQYPKEFAPIKA